MTSFRAVYMGDIPKLHHNPNQPLTLTVTLKALTHIFQSDVIIIFIDNEGSLFILETCWETYPNLRNFLEINDFRNYPGFGYTSDPNCKRAMKYF